MYFRERHSRDRMKSWPNPKESGFQQQQHKAVSTATAAGDSNSKVQASSVGSSAATPAAAGSPGPGDETGREKREDGNPLLLLQLSSMQPGRGSDKRITPLMAACRQAYRRDVGVLLNRKVGTFRIYLLRSEIESALFSFAF